MLMALVAAVAILQFGPPARQAHLQEPGIVRQDVLTALETDAEVQVIISLESAFVDSESTGLAAANALKARVAERQDAVLSVLQPSDFTVEYQFGYIAALAGKLTASGAAKLASQPGVVSVALDGNPEPLLDESSVLVGADDVHVGGFDGSGTRIAVLDTGIAADHPDLAGSLIGEMCTLVPEYLCPDNEDYTGAFPNPDHPAYDDYPNNHGTHVSGIITSDGNQAGVPKGIAPAAGIFMYKVIPSGSALHPGDICCGWPPVIAAIDDILLWNITNPTQRYDFINMSFGDSPGYPNGYDDPAICKSRFAALDNAFVWFRDVHGTLPIAASGNSGSRTGILYPACHPDVLSVGGVWDDTLVDAAWTNTCTDPTTVPDQAGCGSQAADILDIFAPGGSILSTIRGGGPGELTGTSMASPHAAGVAALLKQMLPGISRDEIIQVLKDTGVPVTDDYIPALARTIPRVDAKAAVLDDDFDGDGCSNGRERGDDETLGGLRDPENPWDFYDVAGTNGAPPDGEIDLFSDILGVILHYSLDGSPPYDVRFDRGPSAGPNSWNMTAPDGSIDLFVDILGVIVQYGHTCG